MSAAVATARLGIAGVNTRPLAARELYVSPLFRPARAYAERRYGPDHWLILSARHGLVHPETVLAPMTSACASSWQRRATAGATGL